MSAAVSIMPELRLALANFGPGVVTVARSAGNQRCAGTRRSACCGSGSRTSCCAGRSPPAPPEACEWLTANTVGMVPLPGPPGPGSGAGNHPAVLVAADVGLVKEDGAPAWPAGDGPPPAPPAWCEALVRVPGWARSLRPSRMRYSPQDQNLTPNYDVHDVLAGVGMEDAAAVRTPGLSDRDGLPSPDARVNRIYLTRDLAGAATRYGQQTRGAAAAGSGC